MMKYDYLELHILTPERLVYEGGVDNVFMPGKKGEFQILPNHAPIISSLVEGDIRYRIDERVESVHISGGFVKMIGYKVFACVDI